ncbi:DinB family protein [Pedobacter heparinus]|uniref:DinB family protein n=1 Tax=Pedobacter heparinus TaxID=984 RepID=UPI00292D871B|nr:DinB family protein [Pedobacter heparinus]
MEYLLTVIRQTRENFIRLIESSTLEELNAIPAGFNNNIIWNFGHIIASEQVLCYLSANVDPIMDMEFINAYRKGTKPSGFIGQAQIDTMKELMRSSIIKLEEDLKQHLFTSYNAFKTHYGVELKTTADAVQFFSSHDAFHYGYASAIKRIINNNK